MPTPRLAHEWRHVYTISKGMSTKSETNSYSCKRSDKKVCN